MNSEDKHKLVVEFLLSVVISMFTTIVVHLDNTMLCRIAERVLKLASFGHLFVMAITFLSSFLPLCGSRIFLLDPPSEDFFGLIAPLLMKFQLIFVSLFFKDFGL